MKRSVIQIVVFLMIAAPSYSQINRGGQPFSYDSLTHRKVNDQIRKRLNISNVVVVEDLDKAIEEERIEQLTGRCNSCRSGGKYYGREIDLGVDFFKKALMTPIDDGEIWTLKIESGKSEGFQFVFSDFYLPDGCLLYFRNDEKNMHLGAFTSANNRDDGCFITQHLNGNIAHIELLVPNEIKEQPRLFLDKLVYIFDNSLRGGPFIGNPNHVDTALCHINVACAQGIGWSEEIKSVAIILRKDGSEYYGFCSGALINKAGNYGNSEKPYFLTANYCYQDFGTNNFSSPSNWVFLFRHESTNCASYGSDVNNDLTKSVTGATIVARDNNSATSDYLLLQLANTVNDIAAYDISFAGWVKDENPYRTQVTGIHHPNGDIKKISVSYNTPTSSQFETMAPDHHWKVIWSDGITAKGSSGSPLFNNDHKIIGFLSGGYSYCKYPQQPDYYGKLSKAFSSGNFQNHLGNVTFVNAYSPPVPPINYNLTLNITTQPESVFKDVPAIVKVQVNGGSSTAAITWRLWINKVADDFTDYIFDFNNPNCHNSWGTSYTGNFQSNSITFTQVGTYKAKVYAWDAIGRQSPTIEFSIVVTYSDNKCVDVYIYQTKQPNQLVFAKGKKLSVSEFCNVKTGYLPYTLADNNCYKDWFTSDPYTVFSWYHGIKKIEWLFNDQQPPVSTRTFTTTQYYVPYLAPPPSGTNLNDYYVGSTHCFHLNEAGTHTITLNAYGGRFDKPAPYTQYKYPFSLGSSTFSTATMTIQVVDCDETIVFDGTYYLMYYFGVVIGWPLSFTFQYRSVNLKSGHIIVENITIPSDAKPVNLTAYRTISLKSGTHIQSGARFTAKVVGCPGYKGDCNSTKSFGIDDKNENKISKPISNLLVYPNPTSEIINIDMNDLLSEILFYEIYDTAGRLLTRKIPEGTIEQYHLREQPNGLYLVRIVYKDWREEVKKVILDQ